MKRKSENPVESNDLKIPKSNITSFGASFRRKLKTENAISALQEFVNANKEQNVVDEFVNAGGSVKELVDLLKQFDGKNNFLIASTILSAITHVISRVVSDLLLKQDVTEESCKELLSSYQTTLQNMLTGSSSSISHRKVILKLLTAMVSLSPKLAKVILSAFPLTGKFLKTFSISSSSSKTLRKLRKSFIYFLLSFLVDDNAALITELLQKKGLLISIVPSLIYDPLEIIVLVLNTFRLKIVENIRISKTSKLHTFNTTVLREFLKLYDIRKDSAHDNLEDADDDSIHRITVNTVRNAVQELLLSLCTSSKKGILFRQQIVLNNKNPNQLIFTLLEDIKKPWEDELKSNLITEILKTCPEFVENIFFKWKLDLQPRVSNEWIKLINFVIQVVENQKLVSSDLSYAKITALFPTVLQRLFSRNVNDASIHPHPVVRYYLMRLLSTMLQNISDALILSEESTKNIDSVNLREQVAQFLQQIVIPCNKLLFAWENGFEFANEDMEDESSDAIHPDAFPKDEYYVVLIELLLLYHSLIPISFSELRMMGIVDFNNYQNAVDSSEFRFKLAQLIFHIYNPKPMEANFNFMMEQFIKYYSTNDDSKISDIVENVLKSISFFDGFEEEIIVWMHGLKICGSSDLFVEALSLAVQKSTQFFEQMSKLNQQHLFNLNFYDEVYTDLTAVREVELILKTVDISLTVSKPPTALSPVVFAFLEILKSKRSSGNDHKKSIQKFTSTILIHLMHLQSFVKPLRTLLNENKNMYFESQVVDFISYWDQDELSSKIPLYPLNHEDFSVFLYSHLLTGLSFDQTLGYVDNLNECDAVLAWNICTFLTVRLEQLNLLNLEKGNFMLMMFEKLLNKMSRPKAISCLESLLKNHHFVNGFTIQRTPTNSMLSIILVNVVLNWSSIIPQYSLLVSPYRYKFIYLIMSQRKLKTNLMINREGFTIDGLLKFIALSEDTVIILLQILIPMPMRTYVTESQDCVSEWTKLIICLLNIAIDFMEIPINKAHFVLLTSRLNEVRKLGVSVKNFHDSVIRYMRTFPHQIEYIPKVLVENICRNSSPSIYELAAYLIACHKSLANILQEQILENVSLLDIEVLLETLDRIELVAEIDVKILKSIYKLHLHNVILLLNSDNHFWWRKKNGKWIEKIVSQLDEKLCSKTCNEIQTVFATLNLNEEKSLIIRTYFKKASKTLQYVKLLVEKFYQLLKDREDVSWLCDEISKNMDCDVDFSELLEMSSWEDFVKLCLKISIQSDNAVIMRAFKNLCKKVLSENSKDAASVFKWMISHSEFVNRMLNNSALKVEMIELLLILARINTTEMSSNHVPLLLSSYKASLSESDQLLLQLLQWYENSGIRFSDCRPYLWGEAAASHYSVRAEISVSLARHPLPNQVLESFDMNIIKNTMKYFPLNRPLWPEDSKRVDLDTVYDLAFVLPLLSHLLAPESRISVQKFCRSGSLCLVLIALSCEDDSLRMAAFHCLQRFEFHLHSREKEVQIWHQFVNALKNGLIAVNDNEKSIEDPPRLPSLVTTFLANMSLIICEPLNSLYGPISSFLLAKPSFDLNSIPNFFMLFYSTDLKYRDHQKWILKIIRDGMRFEKDWVVAQKNFLFKFILQYYASSLSNESVNLIILQILENALRIEKCRSFMMTKGSLLSWINQVIRSTAVKNQPSFLPLIVKILGSLISGKNSRHIYSTLILLLHKLKSSNVVLSETVLEEFFQVLFKCSKNNVFSERDVKLAIDTASTFLDKRKQKLFYNVLKFKSVLFLDQHCDNGSKVENCIVHILQKFVRKN